MFSYCDAVLELREMDQKEIIKKFGDNYQADENTYKMGIDHHFTKYIAQRFTNKIVVETCTGAGFSTISLARFAKKVYTVELFQDHQDQAIRNIAKAGLSDKVQFILADILDERTFNQIPPVDAAFLDPDWAVSGPHHNFKFKKSNTQPPADKLLEKIMHLTENIVLILPPQIDINELKELPDHELQRLYLDESYELMCLYFAELAHSFGETDFHINQ